MFGRKVHRPCPDCGRLLVPMQSGKLPGHRKPARGKPTDAHSTPLTGPDSPPCQGGT